ncbi:uncharacterized protein trdn [Garra rufa]|uniref:uncharacterized protein trdn n=1 Tax=Garra rufa TaxID=137080 RepID=UPI003CCE9F9E
MREMEARSSTITTTIVETKNDVSAHPNRSSKRTLTDDLYSTFSSPMAWILVLALVVTWSAVAVIMFDLLDSKGLEAHTLYCDDPCLPPGPQPHRVRKTLKEAGSLRVAAKEVKEKEAEEPVAEAVKEDKQKEPSTCPCMHSLIHKEPQQTQDTKPKEEKAEADKVKKRAKRVTLERKKTETKRREPLLKQRKEKEAPVRTRATRELEKAKKAPKAKAPAVNVPKMRKSRASEDVEVSAAPAPIEDLPMCRPTPVYCPAPPGWYVHHIVTSSPLPPSAIPESEVPILTTHQAPTLLKEPEADKPKPKQATKKKEPAAPKEKAKAKAAPAKKEPTVTKAKVKPSVARKGLTAVKERPKRTERVITKEKAKPTSTKKEPAVTKKAKVTTTSHKEVKAVKEVKPKAEVKKKAASAPKAKKAIKEEVVGTPVPDEKKTAEETKDKPAEAPAKDLKVEENVTEGKKPGKIPYFQCVLMSSKSSQYPLRPMSPAMSPAINPTMMRAMMEQRAALLQQKARAAGQ